MSSTWVFLGLEKNRYDVGRRAGGEELPPVTARNLLTKCYNFFTMVRSENESFSANQKGKL